MFACGECYYNPSTATMLRYLPLPGESSNEVRPPCVKGAADGSRRGIVLLQPFRHGFAVPPPLTQGRL